MRHEVRRRTQTRSTEPKLPSLTLLAAAALVAGAGCREHVRSIDPGPVTVLAINDPPPALLVQNHHRQGVATILVKPCGAPDSAYTLIGGASVASGESHPIPLGALPDCADLSARSRQGELLGQQNDLRVAPGARWTIE